MRKKPPRRSIKIPLLFVEKEENEVIYIDTHDRI
jgi:hypothetical protein